MTAPATSRDASPPIVRFVGVRKSFGALRVLQDIDLTFNTGETTVVLGPSGVGKSVLLKHIAGLLRPDRGEVWFRDTRIDGMNERRLSGIRREIGFLFQQAALFDSMSVEENVAFPLTEHTSLGRAERRERVSEALRTVGIEGMLAKLPAQLSGGQRKRVGLARAIILKPALILYDEPTTGLDPVRADGINELILKMRSELGVSGIVVTHDITSARKVADRLVMLRDGRVVADGTFDELESSPDPYVQHFLRGRYDPAMDEPTSHNGVPVPHSAGSSGDDDAPRHEAGEA